jgi:hypothetical protein
MRALLTPAVLLAVMATAMVAVCQHAETRRLQHGVWQLEKRKASLDRTCRRLAAEVRAMRTPRRLLEALDAQPAAAGADRDSDPARALDEELPAGFVLGDAFEEDGR